MKKVRVLVLGILMLFLVSSCYTPSYPGYMLEGMEEQRLKEETVEVMGRLAEGDFDVLKGGKISERQRTALESDYNEALKIMGAHSKCNVAGYGVAESLIGEYCMYVYVHCNHEYGEIDWMLYFSVEYILLRVEMTPDESSVKDPYLEKI